MSAEPLLAGAAQVEITPPAGTHLSGGVGSYTPAQSVLDPLYAKAVVFAQGERRLAFLALDVTIITGEYTDRLRKAARELGFAPEAVMAHATQTHSAPSLGHFMLDRDYPELPPELEWLRGSQRAYGEFATARAAGALRQATEALRPAQLAAGSGLRDGLAFNRRGINREGRAVMPWLFSSQQYPLGPTQLRYLEGPTDPEVGVVCVRGEDLSMIALLLHFSCHPVNVFGAPVVSADWPGAWAREMQATYGESCVGLVLNGCCGDLNPWPPFQADFQRDHRRMGRDLGEMTLRIIPTLRFAPGEVLDWRLSRLELPLKELPAEDLRAARALLDEHPEPQWADAEAGLVDQRWFRAASLWSMELLRRRSPRLPYEVQAFRVGDTGFVGLPGEPFVAGQLAIKLASAAYPTYVAHCCTDYAGYLPTAEAFPRGGHEVEPSYWAKLAPESLELVVAESAALLRQLFPEGGTS